MPYKEGIVWYMPTLSLEPTSFLNEVLTERGAEGIILREAPGKNSHIESPRSFLKKSMFFSFIC